MNTALVGGLIVTGLCSWLGTWAALKLAQRHRLMDTPNQRSSHSAPTPHGGGLGMMAALIPALAIYAMLSQGLSAEVLVILGAAMALAALSWLDDVTDLSPAGRFLAQIIAVAAGLYVIPAPDGFLAQLGVSWLPRPLELILVGLGWVWFVNLYNFMDGIDGITGVQTTTTALGIAVVAGAGSIAGPMGLIVAAAALGFLMWNWHPAKVFMGDVGSVPLGYLMGWLLLTLAAQGQLAAAVILPLYYLTDATLTLFKRAARGEKVWQAHRTHAYQRAVQAGRSHAQVSIMILITNLALVILALWASAGHPWSAMILAVGVVTMLLWRLSVKKSPA